MSLQQSRVYNIPQDMLMFSKLTSCYVKVCIVICWKGGVLLFIYLFERINISQNQYKYDTNTKCFKRI